MNETKNRYSGIPRIQHAMEEIGLPQPVFTDQRGTFKVWLYNIGQATEQAKTETRITESSNMEDP